MKITHCLFALPFVVFSSSCFYKNSPREDNFSLIKSEKVLSFTLDANTKSFITTLFPYMDENEKEYLTFQNEIQNEILFYDMNSCELLFKVKPQYEGNNGVGEFNGYYIKNLDSIFLTSIYTEEIILIDRNAKVINKYPFNEATGGIPLQMFYSVSFTYHPIVWLDNKIYIIPICNRWTEKNPVCAYIDTKDYSVHALLDFSYPTFPGANNKAKLSGIENEVCRFWDEKQFIYAFFFDEDIYVASQNHESIRRVKVKSKYIDHVELLDDYGNLTFEDGCKNPNYGNMFYDPYRDVYYRIAYPKTEIEQNVRALELLQYGRKNFSIIILDNKFNIIGETLFPDYTYNSTVMFIRKDGLYISSSHYLNPDYSDDVLSFQRFDLVKKQ
jgi:hypothetical protein